MQKSKKFLEKIKALSLTKKIIYGLILVILVFGGIMILRPKNNSANITTDYAKIINLKQTVLATGQVTSNTDLNLSFFSSGIVRSVKVKVGDTVKNGQILATLDQGNESASLTSAKGALAAAEAKYQSILNGASNEEIHLAQVSLDNAKSDYESTKSQQEILVENAYKNLLNSTPEALPLNGGTNYVAPKITGNLNRNIEGQIKVNVYYTGSNASFSVGGIAKGSGSVSSTVPQPLGDSGLYILFPTDSNAANNTDWVVNIPNTNAPNYVINYNAYQAALKTQESALNSAQSAINQRQAELTLKQAAAKPADLELAKANILSAQGQLELATSNFEHTIIRAPANGTITKVDIKIGELAQAQKDVMTLQDIHNMYLEANVNEANVTSIKLGDPVDVTFDALNSDQVFKGSIVKIDPSSTIVSGVVNYKVTADISNDSMLRPGMTANMTILAGEKNNALAIPSRAILKNSDTNKKTVRLVTNPKSKTYKEVEVTTGMEADGGLTEITSGLKEGDEIVVLIKK